MNDLEQLQGMLPILLPILVFQVGFQIYCIINLIKVNKVRFNNKLIWAAVILIFNLLGGIVYLTIGREEE